MVCRVEKLPIFNKNAMNKFLPLILAGVLLNALAQTLKQGMRSIDHTRVEVSYAYPLLSVGYIVTALAGWLLFDEAMDLTRWSGIGVICCGVWLITRTA